MIISSLLILTLLQQGDQVSIWTEVARSESLIHRNVNQIGGGILVLASDPVRGYYIEGQGVLLTVPIRHRNPKVSAVELEFPNASSTRRTANTEATNKRELTRKITAWQTELKRRKTSEEASYDKVVQLVRGLVPELISQLKTLKNNEHLMVVIEEREPAWIYASFGSGSKYKRKVTTLNLTGQQRDIIMREPEPALRMAEHIPVQQTERTAIQRSRNAQAK